jgi:protein kinase D
LGESPPDNDTDTSEDYRALNHIAEDPEGSRTDDDDSHSGDKSSDESGGNTANIPLMRVVQSVKHTKRAGTNIIREGWMVHHTNRDKTRRLHFWRLDTKSITMFSTKDSSRYFKEIQLSDIVKVEPRDVTQQQGGGSGYNSAARHVFEIHTAETVYYVGDDSETESEVEDSGLGRECAIGWKWQYAKHSYLSHLWKLLQ